MSFLLQHDTCIYFIHPFDQIISQYYFYKLVNKISSQISTWCDFIKYMCIKNTRGQGNTNKLNPFIKHNLVSFKNILLNKFTDRKTFR